MTKIGYARVSSKEQNLDRQLQALEGVSKVFSDKLSGATTERPQLQAMLDYIREGDIVVVSEVSPIVVLLPGTTFSVVVCIISFSFTMIVFSFCFV